MQQRPFRRLTAPPVFIASAFGFADPCAGASPTPVSPGGAEAGARVQGRCPTFSWTGVGLDRGYELALYRVKYQPPADAIVSAEPELIDRIELPAGSFFETDGECGLDGTLDNCGDTDWYLRVD